MYIKKLIKEKKLQILFIHHDMVAIQKLHSGLVNLTSDSVQTLHLKKMFLHALLSFIMPNGSTDKNTIIYTKYKNTFAKQNIKTDYKLRLQFILY